LAITTRFAEDQIGDIFAQNPTQNTRAHQRISVPGTHWDSKNQIIGTMAMVMGILSMIAVRIAAHQRRAIAVATIFVCTPSAMRVAIKSSTPAASSHHTSTKSEVKKRNTESSIRFRYF